MLLFASLRSVNAEREPYLRDIIDSNGVLSEHTLHTAATGYSVEALRMEDQNQLEFDTISLEDIDSNLIHAYVSLFSMTIDGSWNSKTWWKLPTITFLLLEENLSGDREWIERINLDVIWDGIFCCPFAEYWATQGKCGMQCQGYSLPFLVKQHFTRVPVITKIGIMDQRIATYCFLSRETSEKVTVTDISHSFRGHDALSKVTISNMSPKLTSVAYKLYSTRGMCEIIKKSIVIEKIEPTVVELRIGHGVSVGQPIWFPFNVHSGNTANASIVSRQYQHRVQRAQYSCLKSGVVLTGDQLDNVQIEAMRDADALIIYFVVNITVNEEGNYGLYDCFLRLEVLSQSASHRDTEKQIVYKLYFRTIQINPVHWKEQALAAHSMLTELSRSHKRINEGIKDIENIMDYTDHQLHNMSEYIKPCKACYDERYIFYTIYGIIILAGLFALIAMICICTCVTCERSRVHRQTISTLENLDSSGVSGSSEPEYDVFLSYCSTDREWVENELLPKLEDNRSFYPACHTDLQEDCGCILPRLSVQRLGSV